MKIIHPGIVNMSKIEKKTVHDRTVSDEAVASRIKNIRSCGTFKEEENLLRYNGTSYERMMIKRVIRDDRRRKEQGTEF